MLSRRAFLGGTAGVATAGAAAVALAGPERVLRRLGLRSSPDHRVPASGWEVREEILMSRHLEGDTTWAWARPPGNEDLLGAVVCLHGRNDDHRFAFDDVHLHDVVAAERLRLAIVAVDGGVSSYWHAREDGSDAGTMVVEELVPLVREQLGVERFGLLGWSMGGYGALLAAERRPDAFAAVVASSPALWRTAAETPAGAFDDAEDFERHDVLADWERLDPARIRLDCGDGDPFLGATQELARRLGPTVTTSFPGGYHDAAYWRSAAPAQVRFLAACLRQAD